MARACPLDGGGALTAQRYWCHPTLMQGVFLDTDGTLINSQTVPQELVDQAEFPIGVPGTTWHSAVDNDMFRDMPEVRQKMTCFAACCY